MIVRYSWIHIPFVTMLVMMAGVAQAQPKRRLAAGLPNAKKTAPAAPGMTPAAAPLVPSCEEKPWYCGTSAESRASAMELYAQGNQRFDDGLFSAAVTSYRAALVYWNHPGIHYNLMLALVALDQPIEAYESSIEALRYDSAALKPEDYRHAREQQRLLRNRIAELSITCDEPGAVVTMDGKTVLQGPGRRHLYVLPGQHEIVARKPGYLATHHALELASAKPVAVHMRMLPSSDALLTTRRWPTWKPWAVVGSGTAVGLAGSWLQWRAVNDNRRFQEALTEICPEGCTTSDYTEEMRALQRRYRWYRPFGTGASVAGGAALLGGLVLAYLNRPQHIENPDRAHLVRISLTPLPDSDTNGLAVHLSF